MYLEPGFNVPLSAPGRSALTGPAAHSRRASGRLRAPMRAESPRSVRAPVIRCSATRLLHFSAAHRVFRPDWSEEKNLRVFGPCARVSSHGHNYELEVTVSGPISPETGYVMDLKELKDVVTRRVIDDLDHSNLNTDVPWLAGVVPSTENVVALIWERIVDHIPKPAALTSLLLRETPRHWVRYDGPGT